MQSQLRISKRATGKTTINPSLPARLAALVHRGQLAAAVPKTVATALGLLFIGTLYWVNSHPVPGLHFEFLYLFVCALVGWVAGATGALLCTLFSAAVLYAMEISTSSPGWIYLCNSTLRLAAFTATGWLAAQAGRANRDLELTVQHRTATLQSEIEKHKETTELLEEAVQLFRQVTENITDVFWATDAAKQHVEYVSPAFEQLWGEACETLQASPGTWLQGIHPDDRSRITDAILTKQAAGRYDEEYRVLRPDGSLRWVHDRAFPVKNERGAVFRIVGIAEDITERKRTEHLLQAQRDMGIALGATGNLSVALNSLLEVAMQLEGIDCGGIYLLDPQTGELDLQAHRGLSGSFVKRISHYRADAAEARLVKAGQIVYVAREQIPRTLEVLWGREGLRALAVVPIQHKGIVLGMLNLASYQQDEIPPKSRVGIELMASQFAGAIARISAEDSLRRSEAHLRTTINNAPIALLAAEGDGTITVEDGKALAAMGAKPAEHVRQSAMEVYRDFPQMLDNVRRALAGEEFDSLLEFTPTMFECRFTSARDKAGKMSGFIAVATDVTERFRLQREILEISDREQARIGQDIHDGLCQQLIGMAFITNSLEQSLAAQERPEAAAARKVSGLLDEAITESRRVARGLYPIRLTTQGLVPALEDLATTTTERFGIHCHCVLDAAAPRCDIAASTHLYRIAQEAVNNAGKHSGARNISVSLAVSGSAAILSVQDDGKGLVPSANADSGMGLHIMDYRARLIGGSLQVKTDPTGTCVSCRFPI